MKLVFSLLFLTSCVTVEEHMDYPIHEPKFTMIEMDVDPDCNRWVKKVETFLNTYYVINCKDRFILRP